MTARPDAAPARPFFSSGPCAKPPGWSPDTLATESLGRSHRSKIGKARLAKAIDLTREILGVPADYRIAIVPASDTGAVEMAMWTMLGQRPVTVAAWESFGEGWVTDAVKQLKIDPVVVTAPYGELPDLGSIDPAHDLVFTWNGTTSGVRVPNGNWIAADRAGLTINDATSAVFAQAIDWAKCDVTTFSWQKVMGSEGGHGMLILSPRAVERLESYVPDRPLPKIFRLTAKGKLIEGLFKGETINTPSMLATEDYIASLEWAQSIGGLPELFARADRNAAALDAWVQRTPWIEHLAADPAIRSNTSVCLKFAGLSDDAATAIEKKMVSLLEAEDAAYDLGSYRDAPPGLRIWCGATVDTADIEALGPWLDWAYAQATA
ncbi:phosphoserine transaminase [Sphingomonas prati]|uniref:phosphoserine transaminase n=1 Tax=Sphingomonas prati TaxID=1843237 RepID=A0A7W9BTQ5_9SPHN|nr:phosphoserine transaminase [Sphingomonas prati]MBB5729774.1 phosphoserine aminotransferase [Sphingomonas prati]GGE89633.1 phosphoserine aminotransferase [Sphingomonas prati]